jgi:Domain of unknown function (DUF4386)
MATRSVAVSPEIILGRETVTESQRSTAAEAQERSVLRWGGLSGLLAGLTFVVSILFQVVFIGTGTTASGAGPVMRFPGLQTSIIIGQSLFLAGTVLAMPLFLALYRAMRASNLAPAIFGTGLSFLGLAVLAVESEPNVAMAPISAQYHAAGATAAQQATAVQLWQATQGMFNQFDTCAYIFLSIGFMFLGLAMIQSPTFGKVLGAVIAGFGVAGLLGVAFFAVTSGTFAIFALLTFVIFPVLIGWRVYSLSKRAHGVVPATPS